MRVIGADKSHRATNSLSHGDLFRGHQSLTLLGASLAGQKKYAEAELLLLEGYQGMAARKERIRVPDWRDEVRAQLVWFTSSDLLANGTC